MKKQKSAKSRPAKSVPAHKTQGEIVAEFYDALPKSQTVIGPYVFGDLPDHVLAAITDQMLEEADKEVETVKNLNEH